MGSFANLAAVAIVLTSIAFSGRVIANDVLWLECRTEGTYHGSQGDAATTKVGCFKIFDGSAKSCDERTSFALKMDEGEIILERVEDNSLVNIGEQWSIDRRTGKAVFIRISDVKARNERWVTDTVGTCAKVSAPAVGPRKF